MDGTESERSRLGAKEGPEKRNSQEMSRLAPQLVRWLMESEKAEPWSPRRSLGHESK
jgi:hypothetical protein